MSIWAFNESNLKIISLYNIETNGKCECGNDNCHAVGKHPRMESWQMSPQWSDEQLEAMEKAGHFKTGFGFLLDDHLIIDIDPRNGGNEGYKQLCDDTSLDYEALASSVVETGGGGRHIYFSRPASLSLKSKLQKYKGVDFKSSGFVVAPESYHKSSAIYEFSKCDLDNFVEAPKKLLDLLEKKGSHRTEYSGQAIDVTDNDLKSMLSFISSSCDYDDWINVGMAVHDCTGGSGVAIWDEWSQVADNYCGPAKIDQHWHSFGKSINPVTIGSLIFMAKEGGYIAPARSCFVELVEPVINKLEFPHIDLLRPSGLVGEITKYINNCCLFPREHLAVASALHAVSNVAGLRYTDDLDGISINLMMLCVAGSGTGKEAIQQAYIELMRAVGTERCLHGAIKSEQEMIRNLLRNQQSNYLIDEYGYQLQKIENARKKGGATYLEGVNAFQMSAFSKANGRLLISGDLKDETRERLNKELSQCYAKIDANEDNSGFYQRKIDTLENRSIPSIDSGIDRPWYSLLGFTTPVSFNDCVTMEQATNGFISRCLLVIENENNPKRKRGFKPKKIVPDKIKYALRSLFSSEQLKYPLERVENYNELKKIPTEPEAVDLLDKISDWVEEEAEKQKGRTGLEAIVRRTYEMVSKVSTTLSSPARLRTLHNVQWAFEYAKRDLNKKLSLAHTNDLEDSKQEADKANALCERILSLTEEPETMSVIKQRLRRKYNESDITMMIDHLVENKKLKKIEKNWSGRVSVRYNAIA